MLGSTKKAVAIGLAALTLGGAFTTVSSTSAEAQGRHGWYGGSGSRGQAWGRSYRPNYAYGAPRAYSRAYRYGPAYSGGYNPYYRRSSNGGAVAAGVIGGLALGAIAANAARPAYYGDCWTERRRTVDQWGRYVYAPVRVCR